MGLLNKKDVFFLSIITDIILFRNFICQKYNFNFSQKSHSKFQQF